VVLIKIVKLSKNYLVRSA